MKDTFISEKKGHMTLFEAHKGGEYTIRGLYVEEAVTRRLQALGLNEGTTVTVLNRKRQGALIIQVSPVSKETKEVKEKEQGVCQ